MAYEFIPRLIEKKGRKITMQRLAGAPANSTTPWEGAGTPTIDVQEKVSCCFVPHSGLEDLGITIEDSELLKRTSEVGLLAGTAKNDFTTFHQFVDGGKTYKLQWIRVLKPGDQLLLYAFGAQR